jgi:hypothetical protein
LQEDIVNNGNWNINDWHLIVGAAHEPAFDKLMAALRLAEKAVQEDEPRLRKLPRPWLSDPYHLRLKREMNRAKGEAMDYLLDHPHLMVIQRRLG